MPEHQPENAKIVPFNVSLFLSFSSSIGSKAFYLSRLSLLISRENYD